VSESKDHISQDELRELDFLEALQRRLPEDVDLLKALADLYTRVGRYEDGLKLDEAISRACKDEPLVWYNLGCSYALTDRRNEALKALSRAVALGYRDVEWMRNDTDLRSLRDDKRFRRLLRKIAG
jgi:predicted Zn-dependent protease